MRQINGSPPIPRIQEELCANMLAESIMIANNGFPYQRRDLFMEDSMYIFLNIKGILYVVQRVL